MLTTSGYIDRHITRTGDYDALLVLFVTWYTLSFYQYLETKQRKKLWHVGIVLAVLTKSIAGVMILPALLIYAILRHQFMNLLTHREVYVMALSVIAVIASYYTVREYVAPGYWQGVYESELGGRLLNNLTCNPSTPWTWYLDMLLTDELLPWLYILPFGLFALLHSNAPRSYHHIALLLVLAICCCLIIISSAATKYFWYEAPIYPFCALLAGAGLALLAESLIVRLNAEQHPWTLLLMLICVFAAPLTFVWNESFHPIEQPDLLFGRHIRRQAEEVGQIDTYSLLSGIEYNSSIEFYRLAATRQYGHTIRSLYPWQIRNMRASETVIVCNPAIRARLDSIYVITPIFEEEPCSTLLITAVK